MKKKFGLHDVLLFIYYVILLLLQFNVKIINAMNNNEKKYIIDKILDVSIQPKKKDYISDGVVFDNSKTAFKFSGKIERNVSGTGYHRKMGTAVNGIITTSSKTNGDNILENCRFLFIEGVSKLIYYDLDELRMHEPFGGVIPHALIQSIDVEKPAGVSKEHVIGVEVPNEKLHLHSTSLSDSNTFDISFEIEVPFHLRYQAASWKTEFNDVPISYPIDTYFTCNNKNWNVINMKSNDVATTINVPVGNMSHQKYVGAITLFMAMSGAFYVFYNMK